MKKRIISYGLLLVFVLASVGCAPRTFIRTMSPGWASIEIRHDVPYDKAWATMVDLLVRRFDLEILEKDDGYIRTAWIYTWTGRVNQRYRVRVTVKFSNDKRKVDVKSEAGYMTARGWRVGTDTLLTSTLKTDIMGSIGRITR